MRNTVPVALVSAICLVRLTAAAPQGSKPAAGVRRIRRTSRRSFIRTAPACHRPGEIAPMSLLTYDEPGPARRRSATKSVKGACRRGTRTRRPERSKTNAGSTEEKEDPARWAPAARRRATRRTCRRRRSIPKGWTIGKPDVVFEMQEDYKVPAEDGCTTSTSTFRRTSPNRSTSRRSRCARQPQGRAPRAGEIPSRSRT